MPPALRPLLWASAVAGGSLSYASTAWLLSGLTPSPLMNAMLPALSSVPALFALPRQRSGYLLKVVAVLLLLLASFGIPGRSPWWVLLAAVLLALGERISALPMQQTLLRGSDLSVNQLRSSGDLGQWIGTVLTGVLFPLGRALAQYLNALVLLLPLLLVSLRAGPGSEAGMPEESIRPELAKRSRPHQDQLHAASLGQGMLFGGLFAMIALWVRQLGSGNCFDFGMVLSAYLLGRAWRRLFVGLAPPSRYGLMAALLIATQFVPGWGAVALFLPLGGLAAASDQGLAESIDAEDKAMGWDRLERSGGVGGLAGSLGMGLLAQVAGLSYALPVQVGGFGLAVLCSLRRPRSPGGSVRVADSRDARG
ncbi:MAG: hypothetical protein HQ527_00610 [Cyanobacteria bacterium]|nr:hypothetical protein [Cyanobacteria bacterium bin.51]